VAIKRKARITSNFRAKRNDILMGYEKPSPNSIGFNPQQCSVMGHIELGDELPILTFAPTGSGKGRGSIIPTLLTVDRQTIAIDPKGELFAVTARRRREMGHQVIALDPFGIMADKSDTLNPLDLLTLPGVDVEAEAQKLAEAISHDYLSKREAFWDQHGTGLLAGLLHYAVIGDESSNLQTVRKHLVGNDPIHKIAESADELSNKKLEDSLAYYEFTSFLNQSERETRPSVLASCSAYLKTFNSKCVIKAVEKSSFKLTDIIAGKPMTIYLIIPADKLNSHRALLRFWLGSIIGSLLSRSKSPPSKTLLLVDECGQLGTFDTLKQLVTLVRGFGVQPWLFFQSLYQLKENYGEAWRLFVDNAGAVQAFGFANQFAAGEWGEFFGRKSRELLSLPADEQFLHIRGQGTIVAKRLDYLNDSLYTGLFDPNPFYESNDEPEVEEPPRKPK
jgi:type IV secretion system protein VirD4